VVWGSIGQDGSSWGIFGQRLDSSGSALGAEFQVNSYTSFGQYRPAVSHDSAGNFVVTWESYGQDGSEFGVFGQRFDSTGGMLGSEFQANSHTAAEQCKPALSHDSAGNFVVAWTSYGQDGSYNGIFGQRFGTLLTVGPGAGGGSKVRILEED